MNAVKRFCIDYWRLMSGNPLLGEIDEREVLRAALVRSMTAIDDWLNLYASDLCDEARVKEAEKRIGENGTLWYIATVQEQNLRALGK